MPPLPSAQEKISLLRQGFFKAIDAGDLPAVTDILARYPGAVGWKNDDGNTGLMCAAVTGNTDIGKTILGAGAGVDDLNKNNSTALMFAAVAGNREMAALLLSRDADFDRGNVNLSTALMAAARTGQTDIVQMFVEQYAADTVPPDKDGLTAERHAKENGYKDLASYIAKTGKKMAAVRQDFFDAIGAGDARTVGAVLAKCPQAAKWRNSESMTGLMCAAMTGDAATGKLLIDAGAGVDAGNRKNSTALMMAAAKGHLDMAKLLLASGAAVDRQNDDLSTALMASAWSGHNKTSELLVEDGKADATLADKDGVTADVHAANKGERVLAAYLEKAREKRAAEKKAEEDAHSVLTGPQTGPSTPHQVAARVTEFSDILKKGNIVS